MHRYLILSILWLISLSTLFAATVTGTVLGPDGKPVADAQLFVWLYGERNQQDLRSGADGGFSIVTDDSYIQQTGSSGGVITAIASGFALTDVSVFRHRVLITLAPEGQLHGMVTDTAGVPLAGVSVRMQNWQAQERYVGVPEVWNARFTTVTSADGSWVLPGAPRDGSVRVVMIDDRYVHEEKMIDMRDGHPTAPVQFTARPGATVSGRVFAPDGKPATDARVYLQATRDQYHANADTDTDGSYRMPGIAPGIYTVYTYSGSRVWIADSIKNLTVREGKETKVPDIHTRVGAVLQGDVLDAESGQPIPDVRIHGYQGERRDDVQIYIRTDAQGHFCYHIEPAKLQLLVRNPPRGYLKQVDSQAVPVDVQEGKTSTVTLKLRKGLTLTGVVQDEQGVPLADVRLRLVMPFNANTKEWNQNDTRVTVITDEHGCFTATGLPTGQGTVEFVQEAGESRRWQVAPQPITLPAPAPLTVTLHPIPRYTVRGRVLDTKHHPLSGVTAVFDAGYPDESPEKKQQFTAVTGDDGVYQFTEVPSGMQITLRSLSKPGYRLVDDTLSCMVGENAPDDLVMTACATTVRGVVRTAEGAPVAGAVVVSAEGGRDYRAVTDAAGAFTLTEQPEGILHLVAATAAGGGLATVTDTTQDAAITFTPAVIAKPGDISLLMSLYDEDAKLPQEQRLFNRADLIHAIAEVDVLLAFKMVATEPQQSDGLRAYLLGRLAASDPAQAEKIGVEQLDWMTDDRCRLYAAVELGVAMAKRNPNITEHCYAIAKAIYDRTKYTRDAFTMIDGLGVVSNPSLRVISLAGLLNKTADIDAIIAQVNAQIKQDESALYFVPEPFLAAAARVSPEFFLSVYDRLEANSEIPQFREFFKSMAQTNPQAARRLLQLARNDRHTLEFQLTCSGDELRVVNALGKTDPTAALEMAQELSSHQSEALLIAAQYQPKEAAAKILQEVFADEHQITRKNLARAIAVDPVFAKSLYDKNAKQLWADGESSYTGDVAEDQAMNCLHYAYLIAPLDPVEACLIIESSYAKATANAQGTDVRILQFFPQAMCALDVNRALAMLRADPTTRKSYRAYLAQGIMHYIAVDNSERAIGIEF